MSSKAVFLEFAKRDDDQQIVEGIASTEAVDSDGEVIDYEAIKEALGPYMQWANLREMHQLKAAGIVLTAVADDLKRQIRIAAHVVDPGAWAKVKAGVYKGFSIGGRVLKKVGNRVLGIYLREISLVDRPANHEAVFTLFKFEKGVDNETVIGRPGDYVYDVLEKALSGLLTPGHSGGRKGGPTMARKMKKDEVDERMKGVHGKLDEAYKAAKAHAKKFEDAMKAKKDDEVDEDEVDECTKAMADIFSPDMFSVPAQKAAAVGDLKKALEDLTQAMKGGKADDMAKAQGAAIQAQGDALGKLAGAMLQLGEKVEKALGTLQPPKAATGAGKGKEDDTNLNGGGGEKPTLTQELEKAAKDKDPMAALRAIHNAGGNPEVPLGF